MNAENTFENETAMVGLDLVITRVIYIMKFRILSFAHDAAN